MLRAQKILCFKFEGFNLIEGNFEVHRSKPLPHHIFRLSNLVSSWLFLGIFNVGEINDKHFHCNVI